MTGLLLNHARAVRVEAIGAERQPLLIMDDCLADPQAWRVAAAGETFAPIGRHYPGVRAHVAADWARRLRTELAPAIADAFAIDPVPALHECFYSIVTTAPAALAPIQRLPPCRRARARSAGGVALSVGRGARRHRLLPPARDGL